MKNTLKPILNKEPQFSLFWVMDGSEDWFIISPNRDEIGDKLELNNTY